MHQGDQLIHLGERVSSGVLRLTGKKGDEQAERGLCELIMSFM